MKNSIFLSFAVVSFCSGLVLGHRPGGSPGTVKDTGSVQAIASPGGAASAQSAVVAGNALNEDGEFSAAKTFAILEDTSIVRRNVRLARLFESIREADFANALSELEAKGGLPDFVLFLFFGAWTEKAPTAAMERASALSNRVRIAAMTGVAKCWAMKAPEAAAAWARNAPASDRVYLDKMLSAVASPRVPAEAKSPAEAFRAGMKVRDNGVTFVNGFDVNRTFRDWLKTDTEAAIQEIKSSPVLSDSMDFWLMIYEHLDSTSPERAKNFLKEVPGRRLLEIATALALKYVDSDITRARSFANSLPASGAASLTTQLAKKIVAKDPSAAPTWIQYIQQADPTFLPISIYGVWLRQDPKKAAEDLFKNPAYTSQIAADPDASIAASYVDFVAWVNVAPVEAANFATKLSGNDRYRSLNKIATAWFERDKPAALNWVRDLPEGEGKEFALREFSYELSRASWNDGEALLATLKTPRTLAAGIEGFAVAGFDVNPDEVLKWVRKIGDEKSKSEVLKHAWSRWSRKNGRAASDWLESMDLSEKEREAIGGGH